MGVSTDTTDSPLSAEDAQTLMQAIANRKHEKLYVLLKYAMKHSILSLAVLTFSEEKLKFILEKTYLTDTNQKNILDKHFFELITKTEENPLALAIVLGNNRAAVLITDHIILRLISTDTPISKMQTSRNILMQILIEACSVAINNKAFDLLHYTLNKVNEQLQQPTFAFNNKTWPFFTLFMATLCKMDALDILQRLVDTCQKDAFQAVPFNYVLSLQESLPGDNSFAISGILWRYFVSDYTNIVSQELFESINRQLANNNIMFVESWLNAGLPLAIASRLVNDEQINQIKVNLLLSHPNSILLAKIITDYFKVYQLYFSCLKAENSANFFEHKPLDDLATFINKISIREPEHASRLISMFKDILFKGHPDKMDKLLEALNTGKMNMYAKTLEEIKSICLNLGIETNFENISQSSAKNSHN